MYKSSLVQRKERLYRLHWLNRIIKLFDEYIEENNLLEHQNNEE